MDTKTAKNTFLPGPQERTVRNAAGKVLSVPTSWSLLLPGDAGLTRRVKTAGEHWVIQEKKGRRTFSRGVWAPTATIEKHRTDLTAERSTDAYAKRRAADANRRDKAQDEYTQDFNREVISFLDFNATHAKLAEQLAQAVTAHATPVGSGTVARTTRIPVQQRAEAAVIAWMRHQTTAYESMKIPRVKGKRREVRRMLAQRSKQLLERYRQGETVRADCPLLQAIQGSSNQANSHQPVTKERPNAKP